MGNRWTATDMDYIFNCVFVHEGGFNINVRPPLAWSVVGTLAIVSTEPTRATSHMVLDDIDAMGVVGIESKIAKKPKHRKSEC